ncbi:MAG: protein-L-isoaspartate(D-aspartate) O-methyltransferase [Anaerolineales bacterium]|jgi:protein-L-isoaspartate(D-aspartate) O-methyltransferase
MITKDEFSLTRKRMVEEQIISRGIRDMRVLDVMGSVLRHCFVPPDDLPWAYSDGPLPIGHGQTISQPYIVALMTELLELDPKDRVLEIGTGSGYQAAVLGELAAEVHTVEVIPELAQQAEKNLAELGYAQINVHTGDGSLGWPEAAPYNKILVAAAAPEIPQALLDQLCEGGQMVIPVGSRSVQQLEVWRRTGRDFNRKVSLEVCFVPLRGQFGWK